MPETIIYNHAGILITTVRAVLGGKTYALANITSIHSSNLAENVGGCAGNWILYMFGALLVLGGIMIIAFNNWVVGKDYLLIIIGIILFTIAILIDKQKKTVYTYSIIFNTTANELTVYQSKDMQHIQTLVQALNKALIERG